MDNLEHGTPDDAARIAAIRQLLAHFDWEHHDRKLALEAVERIAAPGWDGVP